MFGPATAAAVAVVCVVALALWWGWRRAHSAVVALAEVLPASGPAGLNALTLRGTTDSTVGLAAWSGKTITLHTRTLGTLSAKIASARSTSTGVEATLNSISFGAPYSYVHAAGDSARVYL